MISLIQHFEADFLWKVSLKILNSGIILKTFTHENGLHNFGRGHCEERLREIILNFSKWLRRCSLKAFLFLALMAILFSRGEPFAQYW